MIESHLAALAGNLLMLNTAGDNSYAHAENSRLYRCDVLCCFVCLRLSV